MELNKERVRDIAHEEPLMIERYPIAGKPHKTGVLVLDDPEQRIWVFKTESLPILGG